MSDNNTFAIVHKYHALGRCVIPSGGGYKRKKALIPWVRYQTAKPSDAQLEKWQQELNPKVWAIFSGNGKASYEVLICPTDNSLIPIKKLPAEL